MPKQIRAKNPKAEVIYRFIGKEVFLKCNSVQYAAQLVQQIESKGGSVQHKRGWMKCNLLGPHKTAKLGPNQIDIEQDQDSEIEQKFCDFFAETLKQAGYVVEVSDI